MAKERKNADLLKEVIEFRKSGLFSEELGRMILLIARNLSTKGNYNGYTWKHDMVSEAACTCIKYLKNFDPERSHNAFAYVTQICQNAFKAYIKIEKKHSEIKNKCFEGYEELCEIGYDIHSMQTGINYESISQQPEKVKKVVISNIC